MGEIVAKLSKCPSKEFLVLSLRWTTRHTELIIIILHPHPHHPHHPPLLLLIIIILLLLLLLIILIIITIERNGVGLSSLYYSPARAHRQPQAGGF